MSSKSDIQGLLIRLSESGLKQAKGSEISEDAYFAELQDIPADLLEAAATMYIASETWFPAPGQIRKEANKLKMTTLRVPTGNEAWAQVIKPPKYVEPLECDAAAEIMANAGYSWDFIAAQVEYNQHVDECNLCVKGGYIYEYDHSAVEATVKLLGGREVLFTEYRTADRARYIDAYKEILERETYLITMPESVAGYLGAQQNKQLEATGKMKELSERLGQ